MSKTILQLKSELAGILHDTDVDKVHNMSGVFNRAARECLADVDFFETKRTQQVTTPIYDKVYNYSTPADLKLNKVIDLRPQVNREVSDNVDQTYSEQFDLRKSKNEFTIEYINSVKTLRFSKSITPAQKALSAVNNTTGWSVGNDATNLTKDTLYYISGGASLNFDLSGATTDGYIENSTLTAVDLSDDEDIASLFMYVYFPDSSIITSVNLRWGSASDAYWNRTVTAPHDRTSFQNGWNLLRFDWNGATEVGAADASAIDYVRVTINYDGTADTDIRVDNIVSNRGKIFEMVYYSDYLFQNSSGTLQEETSSDDDTVILEAASMNVYLHKVAEMAAQQVQQQGGSIDVQYYMNEYQRARKRYTSNYPSEAIKPKSYYYRMNGPVNGRVIRSLP